MKLSNKTIERLKTTYGEWAMVTGATSGIGKEMATKLGEAGFDLVIAGRRENELRELSTHLFDQYKTETVPIVGDLSRPEDLETLLKETEHLDLGIVVLNAGFGSSGNFIDSDIKQETNLVDLNCKSVLIMTHHFANKLKERDKRGAIVMLSSIVAFQGVPGAANYAASKAYVQSLSEALARELKKEGIDILAAAPGPVATGFAQRANMRMGNALKPSDIAVPTLRQIGRSRTVLPGLLTKFLTYNLRMTPRWAKILIMGKVMAGFIKHQSTE